MILHAEPTKVGARFVKPAVILALVCLEVAGAAPGGPQVAGKLPSAAAVLDRYVEATGGPEALLRHKSMTIRGRYQVPASKADLETVAYTKDGKLLYKIFLASEKEYATGYDGQTAWTLDPSGKVTLSEGDAIKSMARDADMYYHLHVLNYFQSMEVVDVKEFNGRSCYHLKGVTNWGRTNEQFYDKETGLLAGYAFNTAWRGGNGDATETFEEYKNFGGVLMPAKTTSRDGDDLAVSLITSVTFDDVDDAVFALPDAVKKAAAAKKS